MIDVNDIIELVPYCTQDDQAALNVLHLKCTATVGGPFTESDVANAIAAYYTSRYVGLLNNNAYFNGVTLRRWLSPGWGAYYYKALRVQGLAGADALPRQDAGIISWRTPISGRRGRGRSYVPFPAEADNDTTAIPGATYMSNLASLANRIITTGALVITGANVATFNLVIYSRDLGTFEQVDHFVTPRKWATQRRRGSFGRPNRIPDGLVV